jgi:hypothetical protein
VVLSHPKLVETGLDLFDKGGSYNFPTVIFHQTGYNLFTMQQASRTLAAGLFLAAPTGLPTQRRKARNNSAFSYESSARARNSGHRERAGRPLGLGGVRRMTFMFANARVVVPNATSAIVTYEIRYKVVSTDGEQVETVSPRQATRAWAMRDGKWRYVYCEAKPLR